MPVRKAGRGWQLLETGQTTMYHSADDGDVEAGRAKAYTVCTLGTCAGTSNIEVAQYAGNQISFAAAGNIVADVAAGLATILTGDIVVVHGSASNDGVYTVAAGGVGAQFTTVEALADEAAGNYVTILKRTTHSNNTVYDRNTRLTWSRYTSTGEDVGSASNGTLEWYNAASVFTLHPANNDLEMVAPDTLRIGGLNEAARFRAGTILECAGFANAINNDEGYRVVSVSFVGGNTDIVLDPVNATLVSEGPGVNASIGIVTRNIFGYAASAREEALAGFTDWRVPNVIELYSLSELEAPNGAPSAVAFPGWPIGGSDFIWSSTTMPQITARVLPVRFLYGEISITRIKTQPHFIALVRGGL